MNEFLEKMKKIINSEKFYTDAKELFQGYLDYGLEEDVEDIEKEVIENLFDDYFEKFRVEYDELKEANCDFYDFITDLYEDVVFKITYEFMNVYNLDILFKRYGDFIRCNSCGKKAYEYLNIKYTPNIDYDRTNAIHLCEECALHLRDFINCQFE